MTNTRVGVKTFDALSSSPLRIVFRFIAITDLSIMNEGISV